MIQTREQLCRTSPASRTQFAIAIKRFSVLAIVVSLMALWSAQADEPEDHYLPIMTLIEQADSFSTNSQAGLALAKYQKAQLALRNFQKTYPTWNVKVVSYRSKYLAERVATLSAPPSPPAESDTTATKPASGATSTAQVKLLEAGAEPRQVLRLHPKPDDKQTLGLTMKMEVDTKIGEMQAPAAKLPAMTLTMEVTVKTLAANGDIAYESVMSDASVAEDPDVMPVVAEAMKSSLSTVKGMSSAGAMSNRGLTKQANIKMPAGGNPQTQQTIDQLKDSFSQVSLPLPEEAVGLGGKWEAKTSVKSQGMAINQTVTYELVSIEGERITVKSKMAQTAPNQKVESPMMPALKLDLKKMVGTGTGELTLDLAHLLPAQGTLESHSELSMEMDAGGQKQPLNTKINLKMHLEPK